MVFATGQFTAGALSSADTRTTTTSVGEAILAPSFSTSATLQPVIALSPAFATKAEQEGIPVQRVGSTAFVTNVDTSLSAFPVNGQQPGGFNLLPLLIIGGALLLSQ